ncbi:MAG: associated Golgi protein [Verrucomicrobia bacterium]|nr:associated Golgi protein [Verrucomicrobiota bacterium]
MSEKQPVKKLPVVKLALAGVVVAVVAVVLLRGVNLRTAIDQGMATIRDVGPLVFFSAMALLPSVGLPISLFTITAGEAFAPQFGMPAVIAVTLAILAFNLALTYWLARFALRPVLIRLLDRYGYKVPRVTKENALAVTLVMRLTPGVPYVVQGYVLGVAEVPFGLYMLASWLCQVPWAVGFLVLGQGLLKGNFMVAAKGLGVIVVAAVAVQWLRKKLAKREG